MKNIFKTMLLLCVAFVGFTACEEETPLKHQTFTAKLETDNLDGATATLSKTEGIILDDVVILTITPDEHHFFVSNKIPMVTADNATVSEGVLKNNEFVFTISEFIENTTITVFSQVETTKYTITLSANNSSMGTVSGGGTYAYNSTITLKATPNTDYSFISWSDGVKDNPRTITVTGDLALGVNFGTCTGYENGVAYVDLGLPSGLLWATRNIGASTPEKYGYYYAWGETTTKSSYSWNTYKYGTYNYDDDYSKLTKYNTTDGKTVLDPEDDAAHVNWGGNWRMPTKIEIDELRENCTWTWTSKNNINGFEVKGNNSNCIFLPAAGYRYGSSLEYDGTSLNYWSSLVHQEPIYAYILSFYSAENLWYKGIVREFGVPVRAVCSPR